MSSPFAYLLRATRAAEKSAKENVETFVRNGLIAPDDHEKREELFNKYFDMHSKRTLNELSLMKRMKDIISEDFNDLLIGSERSNQSYFITIRPDDKKCDFISFKDKVESFVRRACFLEYSYSFEQKGTTPESLGNGFHVHIVAKMKQRSKSEVLRDVMSTWNKWIVEGKLASNCIDVRTTKNPDKVIKDYLLEYKSDDNHKVATQGWDLVWRNSNQLLPIYGNADRDSSVAVAN